MGAYLSVFGTSTEPHSRRLIAKRGKLSLFVAVHGATANHRGLVRDLEADAVCKLSTFLWLT